MDAATARRERRRRQPRPNRAQRPRRAAPPNSAPKSGFIVGPLYDGLFFIGSPLLALAIGIAISGSALATENVAGFDKPATKLFLGVFVYAHLFLVFVRSHANPKIFRSYPLRFTLIPALLFAAMLASQWVYVCLIVLAVWWDVYHSGLQTFGLGRIYDSRLGNDPTVGRELDRWLNLLLYAGPILAGATLIEHLNDFEVFHSVGSAFFTSIPAHVEGNQRYLSWALLGAGIPFLAYYVWAYARLAREGYRISPQKVVLVAGTGLCSIYTWGFNSFGEAFFIMNFFHALQYFAIVWWSEKQTLLSRLHLEGRAWGPPAALLVMLSGAFAYGIWIRAYGPSEYAVYRLALLISILHFWYDGFIWSVRKQQV